MSELNLCKVLRTLQSFAWPGREPNLKHELPATTDMSLKLPRTVLLPSHSFAFRTTGQPMHLPFNQYLTIDPPPLPKQARGHLMCVLMFQSIPATSSQWRQPSPTYRLFLAYKSAKEAAYQHRWSWLTLIHNLDFKNGHFWWKNQTGQLTQSSSPITGNNRARNALYLNRAAYSSARQKVIGKLADASSPEGVS